ncbi:MAG TPA: hypothetical protein VKR81_00015 [Candidatus Binatia bacterium]|nr:hypothetical protein [Candidatus Binatia bacterium]
MIWQIRIGRVSSYNSTVYAKAKFESMQELGLLVRLEELYKAREMSDIQERPSHDTEMADPVEAINAETENKPIGL